MRYPKHAGQSLDNSDGAGYLSQFLAFFRRLDRQPNRQRWVHDAILL